MGCIDLWTAATKAKRVLMDGLRLGLLLICVCWLRGDRYLPTHAHMHMGMHVHVQTRATHNCQLLLLHCAGLMLANQLSATLCCKPHEGTSRSKPLWHLQQMPTTPSHCHPVHHPLPKKTPSKPPQANSRNTHGLTAARSGPQIRQSSFLCSTSAAVDNLLTNTL